MTCLHRIACVFFEEVTTRALSANPFCISSDPAVSYPNQNLFHRSAWILIAIVVLLCLPLSCGDGKQESAIGDDFLCDAEEADWQSHVIAPQESLVYPTKATWYDPDGEKVPLDPKRLLPDGDALPLGPGTLVLDFGQNVAAFIEMGVQGAADFSFDLRFSEAYEFIWDTSLRCYERLTSLTIPLVWLPRDHRHTLRGDLDFEDPVPVGAYRHVRMDIHSGSARLDYVRGRFNSFRSTPDQLDGYFFSEDELLNRIWYSGLYTLDLCTIRSDEGYSSQDKVIGKGSWAQVDGSKRDRMIWAGDLFVGNRVDFMARRDHRSALDSLDYLGEHQRADGRVPGCSPVGAVGLGAYTFLEYNLFWILTTWDQYLFTGDAASLETRYTVVQKILEHVQGETRDGLVELTNVSSGTWCWSLNRKGKASFVNVLYQLCLQMASLMAEALGSFEDAERFRRQALEKAALINTLLWDPERGIYTESVEDRIHVPLDANAMAVLAGLAEDREAGILDYLSLHHDSPYGFLNVDPAYDRTAYGVQFHNRRAIGLPNYFAAEAMFKTGDVAGALTRIRACFGYMATTDPASSMWEFIGEHGRPEMSYIGMGHVWSAGATVLLTQYVLGVTPLEPGYKRFSVHPNPDDLEHVEGRVPTPHGPVFVKVQRKTTRLSVCVEVPEGTVAELVVPRDYTDWMDCEGRPGLVTDDPLTVTPGTRCFEFSR